MAGSRKVDWPSDDELVKMVEKYGTIVEVAHRLGANPNGLDAHIRGVAGLRDRIRAARLTHSGALTLDDTEGVSELDLLRARNSELEKILRTGRKTDVAQEQVLRRLEDAIKATKPRHKPGAARRPGKPGVHEFALLFSDTHASEVVRSDETLGMNEYGWDVMLRRMDRLRDSVLSYQSHRPYPIKRLNVWMLGDMLSGDIHEELTETNDRPAAQAVIDFATDAAAWLEEFVPHFAEIRVVGIPGNHPRARKKPQAKSAHNNGDWLAYQAMRLIHREHPSISYEIPNGSWTSTTAAERWRVLLMHGDGIRSSMPGVPWGGVVRRITAIEQQMQKAKQPIDYACLGHFHTANALDGVGVKTFLNGSVKGLDEYSLKAFGSGRPPTQVLLTFHPERGVTDVSYIDLERVEPASAAA